MRQSIINLTLNVVFFIFVFKVTIVQASNSAMDLNLYEEVLDPEACEKQIAYIRRNDTALRISREYENILKFDIHTNLRFIP
jgi:hypothetical protein